ncbi:MAG: TetR/AcrR family transcriptional regulator [Clostridia bacterium]|nr:TetR/AcrR family transcriptional regulator [Clostridia bacterium]
MLKKLSDEKINEILEAGISEFASHGMDRANTNVIAKKAGVSVGVIYKYYNDKEGFFFACLRHSLETLRDVVTDAMAGEDKILVRAEKLIRAVQRCSREHPDYNVMYNEITAGASQQYAKVLSEQIEGLTAQVYAKFIEAAKADGDIRDDIDPRLFAFFFDNLLMMLQFSYSCDYYRERFKTFCGDEILEDDEKVVAELLKFMESAFTFKRSEILHKR